MDNYRSIGTFEVRQYNKTLKRNRKYLILIMVLIFTVLLGNSDEVLAQGKPRIIQLSGIVLGEDSTRGVPGVHVYVPKAGRGTTTNSVGYFSLPVLVGDEIVISSVGYKRQYYKVPDFDKDNITIVVELVTDTTFLETVEIMPFPTEEIFKEAVIALNLPTDKGPNSANLNEDLLSLMMKTAPADGGVNHRFFMDNYWNYQNMRYGPQPNPLLNPFNWARFFKSLKNKNK